MDGGAPTIGWLCSYAPVELLAAAGFATRRIDGAEPCAAAPPSDLPARLCGHAQRCYRVLSARDGRLDGVVLTNACVAMERLRDYLARRSPIAFVHLLDIPRKATADAVALYAHRLAALLDALEVHFGARVERDRLVARLRRGDAVEQPTQPRAGTTPRRAPRLLVVGGAADTAEVVGLIERLGAVVASVSSCVTRRTDDGPLEGGDLEAVLRALAARSLAKGACPRMVGGRWLDDVRAAAAAERIDGIVYLVQRGCLLHGYAHAALATSLARPVLHLEVEPSGSGTAQGRARLQAFLERLVDSAVAQEDAG